MASTRALLALLALALAALAPTPAAAHGTAHYGDDAQPPAAELHWAERHMREEHHIYNFDAGAFFHLHDFDNSGTWTRDEVLRTYGLEQPDSTADDAAKEKVWKAVSDLVGGRFGGITLAEFQAFSRSGGTLPDLGWGPGHHGDAEYEYEIHHYEKYHNEDSTEAELNHPEDIEHFKMHDQEEDEAMAQAVLELKPIIEQNIPLKFRPQA
ncbi:hypothetical protein Q9L58_006827 [Maublancomyces gigas]|uniref:EF-hand domain-containing protein n=1 Tax=Discina gigas TaxID=1032678 RepID=A0ABR3GEE4_9PEZI